MTSIRPVLRTGDEPDFVGATQPLWREVAARKKVAVPDARDQVAYELSGWKA